MPKLAVEGGKPVRRRPLPDFTYSIGNEELEAVTEVIKSGNLSRLSGKKVDEFEEAFSKYFGVKHVVASNSGTAAVHIAMAAIGLSPGDEVITTAITDIGTVVGILLQNAVPIFADVDPSTGNIDPKDLEQKITDKTKAVIPVHLFGQPCEMDKIMGIAEAHNLYVVEDCAQAFLAEFEGKKVGAIGHMGTFSLVQMKHMTTGEGGLTITSNDELGSRAGLYARKGRAGVVGTKEGLYFRTHPMLAPNYRMTEIQAAIGLVQLKKLKENVEQRISSAKLLTSLIKDLEGISPLPVPENTKHSYWHYAIKIDREKIGASNYEFAWALDAEGIPFMPKEYYLVYQQPLFLEGNPYGSSPCPFRCPEYGRDIKYEKGMCPNAENFLRDTLALLWSENYKEEDVVDIARALEKVTNHYLK